ncbi:MAG TPA: GNAT family N-acetyltransferase [Planctomycetaceae bacterium]|nr:GNAT family N-acetyltransferase [Planctomycetaceae bacterium]
MSDRSPDEESRSEEGAVIRPAQPEDLPAVMALLRPFMEAQQLLMRTQDEVASLLEHGFVAESSGQVVGFAAVEVYSRKMAEIQCLAVRPQQRRQGLGRQLILRCVERARELGVREVMAITASESLFMSCGFHYSLPGQKKALFITP